MQSAPRAYGPNVYAVRHSAEHMRQNPLHNEARFPANRGRQNNIPHPGYQAILAATTPLNRTGVPPPIIDSNGHFARWLGAKIGSGAYGVAFKCSLTDATRPLLATMRRAMIHLVDNSVPPAGATVVIKVTVPGKEGYVRWLQACIRENLVHRALARPGCKYVPNCNKPLCVSRHVPEFFFAGEVSSRNRSFFVTVMAEAKGKQVLQHVEARPPDASMYLELERAACALWVNGIVHADMHKGNVFYDERSKHATIIDFGFAVVLPASLTQQIPGRLSQAIAAGVRSLGDIFRLESKHGIRNLQPFVNRTQRTRGAKWYNPDFNAMIRMYSRLSIIDKADLADKRRKYWLYSGPSLQNSTGKRQQQLQLQRPPMKPQQLPRYLPQRLQRPPQLPRPQQLPWQPLWQPRRKQRLMTSELQRQLQQRRQQWEQQKQYQVRMAPEPPNNNKPSNRTKKLPNRAANTRANLPQKRTLLGMLRTLLRRR